jgi:DNA-binding SARP family transcriptional activator/ABC-type branched-subunit amino acid transport system substrate-binding protein/streptogramin lyase
MEFRILGPLEVESDGDLLPVGRRQPRALLAVLLLDANRVVPRDRLVEALWDEAPPEHAANALQVYVSQLRALLDRELIVTRPPGYLIHLEPGQLDLERFQLLVSAARQQDDQAAAISLREALALWRGPPLADLPETPLLESERRRLEGLRLGALEARIDVDLALGDHAALVPELETLVREHPLRERPRGQLMLALYQSGRQAEALEVFSQGRRLLADEQGLEPSEALKLLQKRILEQDPALGPPPARPRTSPGSQEETPTDGGGVGSRPRISQRRKLAVLLAAGVLILLAGAAAAAVELTSAGARGLAAVGSGSVGEIDPTSGRIVAEVPIPGRPTRIAAGNGLLWIGSDNSGTLAAVNPRTRRIGVLVSTGGFPTEAAVGAGAVWLVEGRSGLLERIDPAYGRVVRQIRVFAANPAYDTSRSSFDPVSVTVGAGSVWVTDGTSRLVRVDPATNRVVARIDLHGSLDDVAAAPDGVWAISGSSATAIRLDRTGRVSARIQIVSRPGLESPYPLQVAVGAGSVWVLDGNTATVTRIDPEQRTVSQTIRIGIEHNPVRLAVGNDAAWVANNDGTLTRIDAATGHVTVLPIGPRLEDVAVAESKVWVSAGTGLSSEAAPIASLDGARVHPLPTLSCSPIYFAGAGRPQYLIVSDLPLQGTGGTEVSQVSQAIQFALRQRSFRAGRYTLGYQACDDSVATNPASPAHCQANAHAYAADTSVIGVIGPWASFCAQIEIPILDRAPHGPLAMIGPSSTYLGLTRSGPGIPAGEPAKYYPTGIRNYVRTIAADDVQAAADAILAHRLGVHRLYILRDGETYGDAIAAYVAAAAAKLGLQVVGPTLWDYRTSSTKRVVARIRSAHADAVFVGTFLFPQSATLLKDLRAGLPAKTRFLLPDGFAPPSALIQAAGPAAEGVSISVAGVPNSQLPPAGRQFVAAFSQTVGETPLQPSASAAQAADVLLNAISQSNGTRVSVTSQLFKTKISNGILGTFSFDPNGDTTAAAVTIYRIKHGNSSVAAVITPPVTLVRNSR